MVLLLMFPLVLGGWIILGFTAGYIAYRKGRSFILWGLYGLLIPIVAIPDALLQEPDDKKLVVRAIRGGKKVCPECDELVRPAARVCKHCGHEFPPIEAKLNAYCAKHKNSPSYRSTLP